MGACLKQDHPQYHLIFAEYDLWKANLYLFQIYKVIIQMSATTLKFIVFLSTLNSSVSNVCW